MKGTHKGWCKSACTVKAYAAGGVEQAVNAEAAQVPCSNMGRHAGRQVLQVHGQPRCLAVHTEVSKS